jgi:hypothetical protein
MDIETKKPAVWNSLWFLWLTTTIIYLVGFYVFGLGKTYFSISDLGDAVTSIIGLFVPYGMFNTVAIIQLGLGFMSPLSVTLFGLRLILPLVLILLMAFNNKIFSSFNNRPLSKFFLNLLTLLIFTALVDLVTWHDWRSMLILLYGLG